MQSRIFKIDTFRYKIFSNLHTFSFITLKITLFEIRWSISYKIVSYENTPFLEEKKKIKQISWLW